VGADGAKLVDELLRGIEGVVPTFDDHVLLRPDVQTSADDVLRERLIFRRGQSPGVEADPRINRYALSPEAA